MLKTLTNCLTCWRNSRLPNSSRVGLSSSRLYVRFALVLMSEGTLSPTALPYDGVRYADGVVGK